MKSLNGIKVFIPTLVWALTILVLSVTPSSELPETDIKLADKIAHFVVYAILSVLLIKNYRSYHPAKINLFTWVFLFIISTSYGILIEFLQMCCIESRFGEVADAVANSSGAIFGLIIGRIWR